MSASWLYCCPPPPPTLFFPVAFIPPVFKNHSCYAFPASIQWMVYMYTRHSLPSCNTGGTKPQLAGSPDGDDERGPDQNQSP